MLVNSNNRLSIIAELDLPFLEIEVTGSVQPSARVLLQLPVIDFQVTAGSQIPGACNLELDVINFSAQGRIDDEANVFGAANLDINLIDFAVSPNLNQEAICLLELPVIDFDVDSTVREFETSELQFFCTILPPRPIGNYCEFDEKLTIDGSEIKIRDWNYDENADRAGATLNVTLLDPADGANLNNYSSVKFEIGEKISGVWKWETLIESGDVQQSSLTFGRTGNAPSDSFSFSVSADLNSKLNKTPSTDLVIYDSSIQTLSEDDFEPILDTEGREYKTQVLPKSNLKLYELFQKIFVERCGFSSVSSNLPNYGISRLDFETGTSFYESLKGLIGIFEPLFYESGNALKIIDATAVLPSGFPAPRTVTISKARALSTEQSRKRLDAFRLIYTEDERNFDFITYDTKTYTKPSGRFGTSGYGETDFEERYREYRKFSQPGVVLSKKLEYRKKTAHNSETAVIGETFDNYFYDSFGEMVRRTRRVNSRIPDLENGGILTILPVREEYERFDRASHPFEKRKRFLKRRELNVAGIISIDSNNQQLDRDFERDISTAYRSGNLDPDMTTRFGEISTRIETFEPQRDGTVKVSVWAKDHLSDTILDDDEYDSPGEIGTNALSQAQNRIYVFDEDNATRSTEKTENFNIGPLPLVHGIPLARRVLKKRKTKPNRLQMELIGRDNTLTKGTPIQAVVREGTVLGNFLIEGRSMRGSREGRFMTITGKQI